MGDVQVSITPNTVDVEPLQQVRFTAMEEGSASQEVPWSVAEKNGGSIDRNEMCIRDKPWWICWPGSRPCRTSICR